MSLQRAAAAKLAVMLSKWSKALRHAVDEHGAPNSFGVVELSKEYGGLRPTDGYRLGTTRLRDLRQFIGAHPAAEISYQRGRFIVGPRAPSFPCRCDGRGSDGKPNTEAEVRAMPVSGGQDDGEGGTIELHTCDGCGCTFGLSWIAPHVQPPAENRNPACPRCGSTDCACLDSTNR